MLHAFYLSTLNFNAYQGLQGVYDMCIICVIMIPLLVLLDSQAPLAIFNRSPRVFS